jgi:hypothetical protein
MRSMGVVGVDNGVLRSSMEGSAFSVNLGN